MSPSDYIYACLVVFNFVVFFGLSPISAVWFKRTLLGQREYALSRCKDLLASGYCAVAAPTVTVVATATAVAEHPWLVTWLAG